MGKILLAKLKEALVSVLPVAAIVFLLNLTPLVNFTQAELLAFLASTVLLIVGISLFNLGADLAMTPMGEHIGAGLTRSRSLLLLLAVSFAMGLLITVAEPDLSVLAEQVAEVMNGTLLIVTVGVGVGIFLVLAVMKILFHKPLSTMLHFFYMILFALAALLAVSGNGSFMPLAFDSGGVTTGPITVPFIMALGVGIAATVGGRDSGENSFGLIAMCSVGPILAVLLLGISADGSMPYEIPADYALADNYMEALLHTAGHTFGEVALALGLIVIFFAILQITHLHLPRKKLVQIGVGIAYTYLGLVIFLTAVSVGFMPIGYKLGLELGSNHPAFLIGLAFLIGMVVVLAEPAVHVLNHQVEEITGGTVSRRSMMIALSAGVGVAIGLSMIRIVFDFSILYYLIPGYFLSLGLSFFVPGIYTAIAFDSGGVASGPLTSSFILPLAVGACCAIQGPGLVMQNAFGIVAMVAMTPLITIQVLGFRAIVAKRMRDRIAMRRILDADDEQIIHFM
ncbi:MAG: DUF1538 domain-containing protein [Clostridia bacterium]|nr:DUF1538 domain-containing protein [Clostridia bacterium]